MERTESRKHSDFLERCFKEAVESLGMIWEMTGIENRFCKARMSYGVYTLGSFKEDDSLVISMWISEGAVRSMSYIKSVPAKTLSENHPKFIDFLKKFQILV